ncbi:MAG: type II toxin-antitoxin system VapC family toxin [Planctomycetia bacterium]|nr:type II toxin-antitoxin system VapC family toxin [Planctomycetia bacterium]
MKPVFADTSFYVALFSPGDVHHTTAVRLARRLRRAVVVTEFVLLELANALARASSRQLFVDLQPKLRANPNITIVAASADLFERGCKLYADRPDKAWSLTDCISFVVMEEEDITEALTADHHFEQAGFHALLLKP